MRAAWMSWSSGKDSAFALEMARRGEDLDVRGLLTTVTAAFDRVSMHGVRRSLLERQAERLGLPLIVVEIPSPCPNAVYERKMADAVAVARADGIEAVVFGDLFLEDVRAYRERMLAGTGLTPVFPLWGRLTSALAHDMLAAGVRATITCLDPKMMPRQFAGRAWDEPLLGQLPKDVDPCGEHGEFHTFVWDAPGFSSPIPVEAGEVVEREGFVFADLVEGGGAERG
jgi:uncharacterized protein (TIGR00290 family)